MTIEQEVDIGKDNVRFHYDCFIGWVRFEDGDECFCKLNLQTGSCGNNPYFEYVYDNLVDAVKSSKLVLLTESPGIQSQRVRQSITGSLAQDLNEYRGEVVQQIYAKGRNPRDVVGRPASDTYTLQGRKYLPLEPTDMEKLKEMYHANEEMKDFPDPFENQPDSSRPQICLGLVTN
jgi:hypothetical protein